MSIMPLPQTHEEILHHDALVAETKNLPKTQQSWPRNDLRVDQRIVNIGGSVGTRPTRVTAKPLEGPEMLRRCKARLSAEMKQHTDLRVAMVTLAGYCVHSTLVPATVPKIFLRQVKKSI